jgi:citrate lyase beta subunit
MGRLDPRLIDDLDRRLRGTDAALAAVHPGPARGRQPVHTVYVPADTVTPDLVAEWGLAARAALADNPPLPFDETLRDRVEVKLHREPIEDLRIDFEDGYGVRPDADEDADAARAAAHCPATGFVGLRCKSLQAQTRRRAVRTLEVFLDTLLSSAADLPVGFVVTVPKVSAVAQVEAMVSLCAGLEQAYGMAPGRLRFELQVETPEVILGPDGAATVARLVHAAEGRCNGLHFGTYDYTAALGIAAGQQAMDHPVADHAKNVMLLAASGTGVPVSDGSTNILPVGTREQVHAGWALHFRLVRRSLERGLYQGWDLHPAQLPTRFAATYAFFRDGLPAASSRLTAYVSRQASGVLDDPATARALAGFLLRGLDCGALDESDVDFDRSTLERL